MNLAEFTGEASRLFLDSAPIIYYVENHHEYGPVLKGFFQEVEQGSVSVITSPVTLAECLVLPLRLGLPDLAKVFIELITNGPSTHFAHLDRQTALSAAELRAEHGLSLADAFQIATALNQRCDAFLTNDIEIQRVPNLKVLVLKDFLE